MDAQDCIKVYYSSTPQYKFLIFSIFPEFVEEKNKLIFPILFDLFLIPVNFKERDRERFTLASNYFLLIGVALCYSVL